MAERKIVDNSKKPSLSPMDTDLPPLRAASLLMAVLARSHTKSLREFLGLVVRDSTVINKVGLTEEGWDLIKEHAGLLDMMRDSGAGTKPRLRIVLCMCPSCHRTAYLLSAQSAPSKCSLTFGCDAKVIKARAATATKTVETSKKSATRVDDTEETTEEE